DTAYGFPTAGRQSYFDDPSYERRDWKGHVVLTDKPDSPVKRRGTLNAIATGDDPRIIVMGGYVLSTGRAADYSSSGPTSGTRTGPDALAMSDRTPVLGGVLAAGTRSGSRVAMNGTSVAVPSVTRMIARELAAGRAGDRTFVQNAAEPPQAVPPPPPTAAERYGAGLIPPPQGE
ncbi:MAG TPA: S8 family serine peptidase, partial [Hyphomicrobiaceae bacterium]|nr:S8 family serine peptidase [Hyphomicrobiaceae bacterium]